MATYAHPETLVSTDWVAQHSGDPNVRVVEVDVDTKAYDEGHVPGALGWAWNSQLCDTVRRDILPKSQFEELMASSGINNDTNCQRMLPKSPPLPTKPLARTMRCVRSCHRCRRRSRRGTRGW